jgi:hypothetical protein
LSELYEAGSTLGPLALESLNDACQWNLEEYAAFVGVMFLQNATKKHYYSISFPFDGDSCTEPLGFWHLIRTYSINAFTCCLGKPGYKIDEENLGDSVNVTLHWGTFI